MFQIIPSLASGDLCALGEEARRLRPIGRLHLDIEDGNFSCSITFGPDAIARLPRYTDAELDAHLMVTNPEYYIPLLARCGVRAAAVHMESSPYPSRPLNLIRQAGMRAGLALNYKTPVAGVVPYLDLADYILLSTNESDCAGVRFKPYSYERVSQLRALLPPEVEIWVDGGVGETELPELARRGAGCAVMGRAILTAADPVSRARELAAMAQAAREAAR